jgi:hypothetical protein
MLWRIKAVNVGMERGANVVEDKSSECRYGEGGVEKKS